jgi:HAD superfamily hydrolase (TIGR01509 family)
MTQGSGHSLPEQSGGPSSQRSSAAAGPAAAIRSQFGLMAGLMFDMGDVLYDTTLWRRWLFQLIRRLGLEATYRGFYQTWDRDYLRDVHRGRREFCEAFEAFLSSVGLSRAQIDEVEAACQARRRQLEAQARPLPGVKATLGRLYAAGVILSVLSDSEVPSSVLKQRLVQFGLGGIFTAVVSSIDLRQTKPAAVCYQRTLHAMGLPAEAVAFVGHDTDELAGAAAVGMRTVAFNYDADARADVYIARFEELLELASAAPRRAAAG